MSQRVETRDREPEQPTERYEDTVSYFRIQREQTANGSVVVHRKDAEFEFSRQGRLRQLTCPRYWPKHAAPGWAVFEQDIKRHSGKHVHQGGIVIFVLEGKGYTVVDGVRYDWEKGDLIVLPIKPGGCEHQHFNLVEGEPCLWEAFVYHPYWQPLAQQVLQRELSPEYKPA